MEQQTFNIIFTGATLVASYLLYKSAINKLNEHDNLLEDTNKYLKRRNELTAQTNELLKAFFNEPGKYTVVSRCNGRKDELRVVDISVEPHELDETRDSSLTRMEEGANK